LRREREREGGRDRRREKPSDGVAFGKREASRVAFFPVLENYFTVYCMGKHFPANEVKSFSLENDFPFHFLPNNVKEENYFLRK